MANAETPRTGPTSGPALGLQTRAPGDAAPRWEGTACPDPTAPHPQWPLPGAVTPSECCPPPRDSGASAPPTVGIFPGGPGPKLGWPRQAPGGHRGSVSGGSGRQDAAGEGEAQGMGDRTAGPPCSLASSWRTWGPPPTRAGGADLSHSSVRGRWSPSGAPGATGPDTSGLAPSASGLGPGVREGAPQPGGRHRRRVIRGTKRGGTCAKAGSPVHRRSWWPLAKCLIL